MRPISTGVLPGVYQLALIIVVISVIKGIASYIATITLARVGNRIVAANQRSMFDKLLNESVGFFANRHYSEFAMRLVTGATAVNQVLTCLLARSVETSSPLSDL